MFLFLSNSNLRSLEKGTHWPFQVLTWSALRSIASHRINHSTQFNKTRFFLLTKNIRLFVMHLIFVRLHGRWKEQKICTIYFHFLIQWQNIVSEIKKCWLLWLWFICVILSWLSQGHTIHIWTCFFWINFLHLFKIYKFSDISMYFKSTSTERCQRCQQRISRANISSRMILRSQTPRRPPRASTRRTFCPLLLLSCAPPSVMKLALVESFNRLNELSPTNILIWIYLEGGGSNCSVKQKLFRFENLESNSSWQTC